MTTYIEITNGIAICNNLIKILDSEEENSLQRSRQELEIYTLEIGNKMTKRLYYIADNKIDEALKTFKLLKRNLEGLLKAKSQET